MTREYLSSIKHVRYQNKNITNGRHTHHVRSPTAFSSTSGNYLFHSMYISLHTPVFIRISNVSIVFSNTSLFYLFRAALINFD